MNRIRFCAFAALVAGLISCKKDDAVVAPIVPASYLNQSSGNTWNYETTDNSTSPATVSTYSLLSSSRDTNIGTRSYHVFVRSDGGFEYKNTSNTDYYEYIALDSLLGGTKIENLYLKSAEAAGAVWGQALPAIPYSGLTIQVLKTDTVWQRGLTMTVKGITYTDVIHVATGLIITSPSYLASALTTDIQTYFAPKVGRISSTNRVSFVIPTIVNERIDIKTELVSTNF